MKVGATVATGAVKIPNSKLLLRRAVVSPSSWLGMAMQAQYTHSTARPPNSSWAAGTIGLMKRKAWRAIVEAGFIIFLFYSNLLMGEFERSGMARGKGLVWALADIFTVANFEIAAIAAVIGYILVEFLRTRL